MMQRSEIGPRIREMRQKKHLTQRELARRAGVSRATVAKVEAGDIMPGTETLQLIAHGLGAHVAHVMVPTKAQFKALYERYDEATGARTR